MQGIVGMRRAAVAVVCLLSAAVGAGCTSQPEKGKPDPDVRYAVLDGDVLYRQRIALPEDATVFYLTTTKRGQQYLFNIGFEDVLTNVWIPFATATLARNSTAANVLSGTQALAVTPAAQNDGVQFNRLTLC